MHPPSVDSLANSLLDMGLPQPLCVDIAREAIAAGDPESIRERANQRLLDMLQPVINATGVLLHTNMGRAPVQLDPSFISKNSSYTNLELNLNTGERGSRQDRIGSLFARLAGAEAGLVVNNCCSAVTLILAALARDSLLEDSGVAISRGELVEIGGGFRVPEVIAESGAKLIEVGTTNRTRLRDYERAIKKHSVKLCLKVHQSNYSIKGFTESVDIVELASLSSKHGIPLVSDIGSGLLDSACPWLENAPPSWLEGEPAAKQSLEAGVNLVVFSGDKLLGGPQAGIILGDADLVERCSQHPLARAFRPGGLVISALTDTALNYLNREGSKIPFWKMAELTKQELKARADVIMGSLSSHRSSHRSSHSGIKIDECFSVPGGGTLPDAQIPSLGLFIDGDRSKELRHFQTPIIARVQENLTILDLRTVLPFQDEILLAALNTL